ncbi:hypothetical protein SAMN05421636_10134 [Pricia antarctica]|uniref:Lipoprotein n=1 Tax=Pricia antarctica TaxID=641691 RepID=A0A1G6VQX3_9FLAO|nr:DUF6503 family protein [Pricia antarctica]SDD55978.1 hypothetical protein SAMN05421636_10134 [Pricia antarctica]
MTRKLFTLTCVLLLAMVGCKHEKKQNAEVVTTSAEIDSTTVQVPASWIENRVAKAKEKLETSDAGKIVWEAMEASGGLSKWFANGPISFHFDYEPLDGGEPRNTKQVVDTWRNRARHFSTVDSTQQFGWDGEAAWVKAKDSSVFNYNTRFWSLTPYFFTGQPFVLEGKGTQLELLDQVTFKDNLYNAVKITYDSGTGDAPDDYYVLYFNTRSRKLEVIRYIVSYPGYFEKGKHLPEKFMELLGEQTVEGITFPENYKTYWLNEENAPGEHITDIQLSEIQFLPELESTYFDIPKDAQVLKGL